MLKKEFNEKKGYLIGKKDGRKVWMPVPSWDCGWYWGFGYLQTYDYRDMCCHTHFDVVCKKPNMDWHSAMIAEFDELAIDEKELWILCDYMRTFYTLKETAELYGRGYSHYTEKAHLPIMENKLLAGTINQIQLPELFEQIDKLLKP